MVFVLSKILGILIEPYYFALTLLACAGALRLVRRLPRLRRGLWIAALAVLVVFSVGPTANALLYPLESRYTRPEQPVRPPGAIVMLGGVVSRPRFSSSYYELLGSADRFVEAVRLAHLYPEAPLLITGGSSAVISTQFREADVLGRLAAEMGLPGRRLVLDREARNTYENAVNTKKLLGKTSGDVLLITSAAHMPRAVACFRKVGMTVIPWPVDHHRTGSGPGSWVPKPQTLLRCAAAMHEYLGWLAYWVLGYV